MVKFSKRTDAIHVLKVTGAAEATLFLLDEQVKHAEADILQCNPHDPLLRDKLVKAQTLRALAFQLHSDLH